MLRPARPGEKCTAFGPHLPLQEAAWRARAVGEPARAPAPGLRLTPVATWPLPLAECSPWLPAFGPAAARAAGGWWWPLAAPRRGGSFAGPRPGARRRRRWGRPALGLAKSLKAPAPSLTPGASNHSVSISLTLFIPLKTHLKTLQAGVRAGLYPH